MPAALSGTQPAHSIFASREGRRQRPISATGVGKRAIGENVYLDRIGAAVRLEPASPTDR